MYCVYGLGMVFCHEQRWQAEWKLEYMCNATAYTLKVMTVVAVIMTPLVLIYQGWTYWVFRKRVSASQIAHPERGILDTATHVLHQ